MLYQPAVPTTTIDDIRDVPGSSGSMYELHPRTILAMLALALRAAAAAEAATTTIILEDGEALIHRVSVWGVVAAAAIITVTVHDN